MSLDTKPTSTQPASPPSRPRRRIVRRIAVAILGVFIIGAALVLAVAWYYADQIEAGALHVDHNPPKLDLRVVSVDNGRIELAPTKGAASNWQKDGIWGIEWPGGYARAGRIIQLDDRSVVRELTAVAGRLQPGDRVRLDSFAYPHNPKLALAIDYQDVRVASPSGDLPAWFIAGSRDTWIVFVHGKGSSRGEGVRLLETTARLGYPTLMITYRNDEGTPASADGRYDYGRSEWPDLDAAVTYARAHGARRVVLAGNSMGGGIVMSFMARSSQTDAVAALILDAPVLDFGAVIDNAAHRRHLPGLVTDLAKSIAARRYGVDWSSVDYTSTEQALQIPLLLFHGDADTTVPASTSDAFAAARPDIVTYNRVAGATHVRAWNMDPTAYDAAVSQFLTRVDR